MKKIPIMNVGQLQELLGSAERNFSYIREKLYGFEKLKESLETLREETNSIKIIGIKKEKGKEDVEVITLSSFDIDSLDVFEDVKQKLGQHLEEKTREFIKIANDFLTLPPIRGE